MGEKIKVKYDRWFLIVLVILLWTLVSSLYTLGVAVAGDLGNYNLWFRAIACVIAIYGDVWVFQMYITNTRRKARRVLRTKEFIEKHPELANDLRDILGEVK